MTRLLALALVALALALRLPNISTHATFSFDQVQDLRVVGEMVKSHTPLLLGPIVRGDYGGFYLGPWYYYLLALPVAVFGPSPLVLSAVSLTLDLVLVFLLYRYAGLRWGRGAALVVGIIAACSPLLIQNSYTAWNVSLIPLWTLAIIYAWERHPATLVFWASLATSIHASLFPLALVALVTSWRLFVRRSPREYLRLLAAALIPLMPLIISDLTHHAANLHLLKFFLTHNTHGATPYLTSLVSVADKTGYTVARLWIGEPVTWLGLATLLVLVASGLRVRTSSRTARILLLLISTLLLSLVYYRNLDFAEYYLTVLFVPLLLLLGQLISLLPRPTLVVLPLLVVYLLLGVKVLHTPPSPYSLGAKSQVITKIKSLGYPVEVRLSLTASSQVGLDYLADYYRVSDSNAPQKVYLYDSNNPEHIAPSDARSILEEVPLGAYTLVVYSN